MRYQDNMNKEDTMWCATCVMRHMCYFTREQQQQDCYFINTEIEKCRKSAFKTHCPVYCSVLGLNWNCRIALCALIHCDDMIIAIQVAYHHVRMQISGTIFLPLVRDNQIYAPGSNARLWFICERLDDKSFATIVPN